MDQYNLSLEDVSTLICDLNYEIYGLSNMFSELSPFTIWTNGDTIIVYFFEYVLFNSEMDEREHFEDTDTYEDFEKYLRKKANDFIKELSTIKL